MTPKQWLAALSDELQSDVRLLSVATDAEVPGPPSPFDLAALKHCDLQTGVGHYLIHESVSGDGDEQAIVTVNLPGDHVAAWSCPAEQADLSGRLAASVIRVQDLRMEAATQNDEIESLTAQVVDDFEELALLRALATATPAFSGEQSRHEIIRHFIEPLRTGLGTRSIAAVSAEQGQIEQVIWSGEPVANDHTIGDLIRQHRDTATRHPVIVNGPATEPDAPSADSNGIKELIVVQCQRDGRLHGWLLAFNRIENAFSDVAWAQHGFTTVQACLLETATNQLATQLNNAELIWQKEELFTDVVRALVNAVEARDPYTCGHSERVASFGRELARCAGEPASRCDQIYLTGLLHDVGKIAIPDGVLQKPGRLDEGERAIIETHTDAGWRILHQLDALKDVLPGVLYHHEHFNGQGYPDGLAGESIPLEGRILAVCDAFDAMTSDRPYRNGMPIENACEILREGSGSYWDPRLIELFVNHVDRFDAIRIAHQPREVPLRRKAVSGQPALESVN